MGDMFDEDEDPDDIWGGAMVIGSETTEAEQEFTKILEMIREAEGMKMYADVFTKLYDSYFDVKENLANKQATVDQLQDRVDRFDETMESYQTSLADANKTIAQLRAEVQEARALADAMHTRELLSVESLETMKRQVYRLEKELEARKKAGDEDEGATSVVKEREKFEKEKTRLLGELEGTTLRLSNALSFNEELERKTSSQEEYIGKLEEQIEEAENNAVRTGRLVDHIKNENNTMKAEVEARGNTIVMLNDKVSKLEKNLERRDKQVKDLNLKVTSATQEMESAIQKANFFRTSMNSMQSSFEKNKQELTNTTKDLKSAVEDGSRLRLEVSKQTKANNLWVQRYQQLEQQKAAVEHDREILRQQIMVMEREIMGANKQAEADKREIENQTREKEILTKNMQKIQTQAQDNLQMLSLQDQRSKQLEHEIDLNTKQLKKQRVQIRSLEKEKDRMLEEAIALNDKIDEITDEVRLRTAEIVDLKKMLREETIKSRKLTVSLDTCRTERNFLHKNYTEALDEIQDLKMKLKMLAYQIEQMKEDVVAKEANLKICEGVLNKAHKKIEMLKTEILSVQAKLNDSKAENVALRQEEARLMRIIMEQDVHKQKLMKELESLMNERDVIGAQLVRRNDEITLLYEKIRILEVTLHRGERQYESRVDDIRLLRLEIQRLRKEKNLLSKGIENMTDLRLEVFNLERELGRERLRVRALEEALETPLNVHRWRKLQGTDPERIHLSSKLRIMQKKVLTQSEALVIKDRQLKETVNLYNAVKEMLALQPSPEIKQTLVNTQKALNQRTCKMKQLIAELSMRERQVVDLRNDLDRSHKELTSYKQKYYDMKRALDADEARRLRNNSAAPLEHSLLGSMLSQDLFHNTPSYSF